MGFRLGSGVGAPKIYVGVAVGSGVGAEGMVVLGAGLGIAVGRLEGDGVGSGVGLAVVGVAEGSGVGRGVGMAVGVQLGAVGLSVGGTDGMPRPVVGILEVGAADGTAEGAGEGAKFTRVKAAPVTTVCPEHVPWPLPEQPWRMTYIWHGALAGGVYCISAQSPQSLLTAVSSAWTCSPVLFMRRKNVLPAHDACGKLALHVEIVTVLPAHSVTPQVWYPIVSKLVFWSRNVVHSCEELGGGVFAAVGRADGAVGPAVGKGVVA